MTSTGQVWPAAQASTAALVLAALIASRRVQLPLLEMPSAVVVTKMSLAPAGAAVHDRNGDEQDQTSAQAGSQALEKATQRPDRPPQHIDEEA